MTNTTSSAIPAATLWQAAHFKRDPAFDGQFFVCVKTTGIYCRPICPARTPKPENMFYVLTARDAQSAGFRACKRCRPDSAPHSAAWAGTAAVVARAVRAIEDGALNTQSVEIFADRFGLGGRQLRRLFQEHIGKTPVQLNRDLRLAKAYALLMTSDDSIADISAASGYQSLRHFQQDFRKVYGLAPSHIRMEHK
jgi:AraC family transcriptional regulator, regulatory protein of adaptative response / DNA-3-methyladenine glycosylase II